MAGVDKGVESGVPEPVGEFSSGSLSLVAKKGWVATEEAVLRVALVRALVILGFASRLGIF
jgi:hypothetical protein